MCAWYRQRLWEIKRSLKGGCVFCNFQPLDWEHTRTHTHMFKVYYFCMKSLSVFFFSDCRMKTLIQSQRSGRTTLKRRCDLPVALLVTMTYANMRCLLKLCNRAEVLETSGAHAYQTCSCGQASLVLVVLETLFSPPRFPSATGSQSGSQGSGSGRPSLYRDEGDDDLYQ